MDELKQHITKLREDFMQGTLGEADVDKDPALQFERWLQQAVEAQVPEVQAMNLSTVSEQGRPSSRVVYLRGFGSGSFSFYGNYQSRKGRELAQNPNASLNFFWPQLERQVRIEGRVSIGEAEKSDDYFNSRPRESQLGAWASPQSAGLSSRKDLEEKLEHYKQLYANDPVPRPPFWGGWVLKADYFEFWQGRKSRLHDRICYSLRDNNWTISRIAP